MFLVCMTVGMAIECMTMLVYTHHWFAPDQELTSQRINPQLLCGSPGYCGRCSLLCTAARCYVISNAILVPLNGCGDMVRSLTVCVMKS